MLEISSLQEIWEILKENADAIGLVAGVPAAIFGLKRKVWKIFRRKQTVTDGNTSPFQIIGPYNQENVVRLIDGRKYKDKNNPLNDFNVPYQQRLSQRNIQQEITELLVSNQEWVLIEGPTGIGKTREVAEVARIQSAKGWTILILREPNLLLGSKGEGLSREELGDNAKLLFVLDNLNSLIFEGQSIPAIDNEGAKVKAIESPLQNRLLKKLKYWKSFYKRMRVIAIVRNEMNLKGKEPLSQWEKLGIEEYSEFWKEFTPYELPLPENHAAAEFIATAAAKGGVRVKASDLAEIARTNEGTFENLLENLRGCKLKEEMLTASNFEHTINGTWKSRYDYWAKNKEYGNTVRLIYDAVDLLQQSRVVLHPLNVIVAARLLEKATGWRWLQQQRQIVKVLNKLLSERILSPREGQIEAKGTSVEVENFIEQLAESLPAQLPTQIMNKSLFGIAIAAYERNNYKLSASTFERLAERNIDSESAAFIQKYRGDTLLNLGQIEEALAAYEAAIDLKPDYNEAINNKGVSLAKIGRHSDAIDIYDTALSLNPNNDTAFYNKGTSLSALGQKDEAISSYEKALSIQSDRYEAFYNKGIVLHDLGRIDEALVAYNEALKIKPNYYEALFKKGNVLDDLDRKEEALIEYNAALSVNPDDCELFNNKGLVLYKLGRKAEAIKAYDQALALKPDYQGAIYNKAVVLGELERDEEAIAAYNTALSTGTNDPEALYNRAILLSASNRKLEAIAAYDTVLGTDPQYYKALISKGDTLVDLERYEDALDAYNAALSIKPNDPDIHYDKACCYALSNQIDKALSFLQKAIELDGTNKYAKIAKDDSDFKAIREYPDFKTLIS